MAWAMERNESAFALDGTNSGQQRREASPPTMRRLTLGLGIVPPNLSNAKDAASVASSSSLDRHASSPSRRPSLFPIRSDRHVNTHNHNLNSSSVTSERPSFLRRNSERFGLGGGRGTGGNNGRTRRQTVDMGFHNNNIAASMTSARGHLMGSLRRLSLDQTALAVDDLDFSTNSRSSRSGREVTSDVSNYQQVFQQMKLENPHYSLGALQQKSMLRVAEIKATKIARERRMQEEFMRQEEEERRMKQGIAGKCLDKFVDKIRHPANNNKEHGHGHLGLGHHLRQRGDSFGSQTTDQDGHSASLMQNDSGDGSIFTHHVTVGNRQTSTIALVQRQSSVSYESARRTSVDSGPQTTQSFSSVGVSSIAVEQKTLYINAGLAGGDDQAKNFAPRKSVGDLTAFASNYDDDDDDDKSAGTLLTDASGLYMDAQSGCGDDARSECAKSAVTSISVCSRISVLSVRLRSKAQHDDDSDDDDDSGNDGASCYDDDSRNSDADGRSRSRFKENNGVSENWTRGRVERRNSTGDAIGVTIVKMPRTQPSGAGPSPIGDLMNLYNSYDDLDGALDLDFIVADGDDHQSETSSGDELIVGFVDRTKSYDDDKDGDDDDGLIVGFGDRSGGGKLCADEEELGKNKSK